MIPTNSSASDTYEVILRFLFAITDDFEPAQVLYSFETYFLKLLFYFFY